MSEPESYSSIVLRLAAEAKEKARIKYEEEARITAEKLEAYRARLAPVSDLITELCGNIKGVRDHTGAIPSHLGNGPTFAIHRYDGTIYFGVVEQSADNGFNYHLRTSGRNGYAEWKSPEYEKVTDLIPVILGKVAELI